MLTWTVSKVIDHRCAYPYNDKPAKFLGVVKAATHDAALLAAYAKFWEHMTPQDNGGFRLGPAGSILGTVKSIRNGVVTLT